MHASHCEVVEVVVGHDNSADKNSDHTTYIEVLSCHVAEDTEEIGDDDLYDLALDQEPEFTKEERADDG